MAYTVTNFKTKKALKENVEAWIKNPVERWEGEFSVHCYQPGLGPDLNNFTGKICLEGPHYPAAHTWYAEVELKDGIVIKVK